MSDVFISYSRRDIDFVRHLFDQLKARDREAWAAWQDIPPTADWLAEIYSGIEAANTFLFVSSPDSVASEICTLEIEHAVKGCGAKIPSSVFFGIHSLLSSCQAKQFVNDLSR